MSFRRDAEGEEQAHHKTNKSMKAGRKKWMGALFSPSKVVTVAMSLEHAIHRVTHVMNTLALSLFPNEHAAEVDAFLRELRGHPEWASTLLAYALHPKVVRTLLELGGDVNHEMEDGTPSLMNRMDFSTGTPNEIMCWKILMSPPKKGLPRPNLLVTDARGQLPIHLIHDEAVFDVLVAPMGAGKGRLAEYVRSVDAEGNTALHAILPTMLAINAMKVRDLERIRGQLLQKELGAFVENAKAYAARQGAYAARFAEMEAQPAFPPSYVARLLREGAEVGARNRRGETPLHAAMRLWLDPLMGYDVFSDAAMGFLPFVGEVIRMLIAAGADVRAEDATGIRPMDLLLSAHKEAKAFEKGERSGQSSGRAGSGQESYDDLEDDFRLVLFAMIEDMVKERAGCEVCGARESVDGGKLLMCGGCERVWYCGTAHQKEHWGAHKAWCRTHGLGKGTRKNRGTRKARGL